MQYGGGGATSAHGWAAAGERAPFGLAVTTGVDHRLEYANPAFVRLTGSRPTAIADRTLPEILRSPALGRMLDDVLRNGTVLHSAIVPGHAGAAWRVDAWPRGDGDGEGLFLHLEPAPASQRTPEDELREVNARLVRALLREEELTQQARAASRAKSDFLALVSHELRTPLTAIIGYSDMLQTGMGGLNEKGANWTDRIRFSAWHLRQIVDDLISTVTDNRAAEVIDPEPTTTADVCSEVLALIEPAARDKGVELRVTIPESPIPLHTDRRKLRQIITNLLSNAVKFTDAGHVALDVEERGGHVRFSVSDTGIGIAPADLERIFEPFVQVDPSTTRRYGGCGLGLGLSRRYADALGGELSVTSTPGSGSTFALSLPVDTTKHQQNGRQHERSI